MTHLSDEAVAAFADGVLSGPARLRAVRHTETCAECAEAVRVQREAVFVLRAAPAPELPGGLLDKLRGLPEVTPLATPPAVFLPDGSAMLPTTKTSALGTAALLPEQRNDSVARTPRRVAPLAATAAVVALAGVLVGGVPAASGSPVTPGAGDSSQTVRTVQQRTAPGGDPLTPLFTADVLRASER